MNPDKPPAPTEPDRRLLKWARWTDAAELAAYAKGNFGGRIGFGARPALLNIDTTHMFVDPAYAMCARRMPALEEALTRVTEAFRRLGLPIFYSRRDDRSHPTQRGMWNEKLGHAANSFEYTDDPRADQWPEQWAPRREDMIVMKNKPSAFFATPLEAYLRYAGVDTLVVAGVSTSGCVRAAVTDAFSHNLRTIVVEEACADRSPAAHRANLLDMDMKFADVESLDYVLAELEKRFAPPRRATGGRP